MAPSATSSAGVSQGWMATAAPGGLGVLAGAGLGLDMRRAILPGPSASRTGRCMTVLGGRLFAPDSPAAITAGDACVQRIKYPKEQMHRIRYTNLTEQQIAAKLAAAAMGPACASPLLRRADREIT